MLYFRSLLFLLILTSLGTLNASANYDKSFIQTPEIKIKQQSESSLKSENKSNQQEKIADISPTLPINPTKELHKESKDEGKKSANSRSEFYILLGYRLKITDLFMLGFSALLTIFTGVLAGITYWQYQVSKKTRRAFVFLKDIEFEPIMSGDRTKYIWQFCPRWGNSGDTRTKNLSISVNCDIFYDELPEDFAFPYATYINIPVLIAPKTDILGEAIELFVEDRDIYNYIPQPFSSYRVYMWGEAKYRDIFNGTPEHRTKFCVELFFIKQGGTEKPLLKSFSYYKRHNCADEDCNEQS